MNDPRPMLKLKSATVICSMSADDLCKLVAKLQVDLALSEVDHLGGSAMANVDKAKAIRREVAQFLRPGAGP